LLAERVFKLRSAEISLLVKFVIDSTCNSFFLVKQAIFSKVCL